jgi:peptidoglycan hydrolase CwlO-like protein
MIKKLILGVVVAVLAAGFFLGRDAASYVSTSAGCLKDSVKNNVPTEFQIERARGMIKDLVPEIRKHMQVIAREEVEVEQLQKQIADTENRLAKEKDGLLRLKADVETGESVFHYASRTYTAGQVKVDMSRRFERYQTGEATLASLHEIFDARQKTLEAARQKLEGTLAEKRKLEVDIENIEAQLEVLAAAQTTSQYNFDDSKLGRVKELIADLRTKLDVNERLINSEGYFHDEIPLDGDTASEDIVNQVAEYFGQSASKTPELAAVE